MNVGDIVTRVRRIFGDDAAVQLDNADIIRWINDGQIEIVKRNEGALQKTSFINLVANQAQYTMPTDLLILRALRYRFTDMLSFNRLKYMNMQQFDESIDGWDGNAFTTGNPSFFTMDEGKALLFPIPSQSVTSGLKVLYNQQPVDVDDIADTISLPLIYHNTLVKYCLWCASLLDEDHEPALMYKNDFTADVDLLMTRETTEATNTYPVITTLEYDL
jgi:hypothetical protein